jgi:hypothetical protein
MTIVSNPPGPDRRWSLRLLSVGQEATDHSTLDRRLAGCNLYGTVTDWVATLNS